MGTRTFIPTWIKRRKEWEKLRGAARAEWYVDAVEDGTLPSCLRVRQAVARWRAWKQQYEYRSERVDFVVDKIQMLKPPEGAIKDNFTVLPWQAFMASAVHGFYRDDGKRACREVLLVVPRKSGKSSFVATLLLQELVRPFGDIASPTFACIGVNEETAAMTFDKAKAVLVHDTEHKGRAGFVGTHKVRNLAKRIYCGKNNGQIKMITLGSKSLEGHTLNGFVADEIARIPDRSLLETIRSGMGHAQNPLAVLTSTPSDLFNSVLDDELEMAIQVLEGNEERVGYFPLIYRAEEGDKKDAGNPHLWEKVQPTLGWDALVSPEFYADEWERLRATDDGRHNFYTRQLCAPSKPSGVWVTLDEVLRTPNPPEAYSREMATRWLIGLDLADVKDTVGICVLGYDDKTETGRVWFEAHAPMARVPDKNVTGREASRVRDWADAGWLKLHPGGTIDYSRIAARLDELVSKLSPLALMSDSYSAVQEAGARASERTRHLISKTSPSAVKLAEPMNMFASMVENNKLEMQKHPVFIQHLKNTHIVENTFGGRTPQKVTPGSPHKIDLVDALLMAFRAYVDSKDVAQAGQPHAPVVLPDALPGERGIPLMLGED